jgi:MFS family permease
MGFFGIIRIIYFAMLGFSPIEIGILLSIGTFFSAIHHIIFGVLSDRFGRKYFLAFGGIFAITRIIIFAISSNFWILALGQGIGAMGEGVGAGQPVVSGYITDKTEIRNRSSIFRTIAITNSLTVTIGSIMAGLPASLQNILGYDMTLAHSILFWIGAGINTISLLFILLLNDVKPINREEVPKQKVFKVFSWKIITRLSLVRSTSGIGWGFIESLMPLYFFMQFSVGGEVIGPLYAGARFLSIFSYLFIPIIVERFGEVSLIIASRIITAVLTILFSLTTSFILAVLLMVLLRVTIMFTIPVRQNFVTSILKPDEVATAIGVSNFSRMSLRTLAPTLAGYMFEAINMSVPFLTGAIFLIFNGLLFKSFFLSYSKKQVEKHTIN